MVNVTDIRIRLVQHLLITEHDREDMGGILRSEIDLIEFPDEFSEEVPEDCYDKERYVMKCLLEKYPERRHPKRVKKEIKMTPIMLRHREVL